MKRKRLSLFLAFVLLLGFMPFQTQAKSPRLWVNGDYVTGDVSPLVRNQRTLVPIRQVSEALGIDIEWNQEVGQAYFTVDDLVYTFMPNKSYYRKGDLKVNMDTRTVVQNSRIFLPLRVISEILGYPVSWDQANYTAVVGDGYVPPKNKIKPFPINEKLQKVEGDASQMSGVDLDTAFSTSDLMSYSSSQNEVLDEILKELLLYLSSNHMMENAMEYYNNFQLERNYVADNYIKENELGGSMAGLEYSGVWGGYTYERIKKLSKIYLGIDTYFPGYDD